MVSNPIIPEETMQKIREVVFHNKKTNSGPQSIKAFLNEAALEKLNGYSPDRPEPQPQGENIG